MCSVTQSIFKTITRLSPALKATPCIIHPYMYSGLKEFRPFPPATQYPVASIVGSIKAGHKYVHSLPISRGRGSSRVSLQELFGGWSLSLAVVQCLKETQKDSSELSEKLYATIYYITGQECICLLNVSASNFFSKVQLLPSSVNACIW